MRISKILLATVAGIWLTMPACGQSVQTMGLRPFVGPSPFDFNGADWLLPRGRQVFDGVPFQIDGVMFLSATNFAQRTHPGEKKIAEIPAKARFERLHLLAAADSTAGEGVALAEIRFAYADGSDAAVQVLYGVQVRTWLGPRHKSEKPLDGLDAHEVWQAQHAYAAQSDCYLRLFHVVLANPSPEKEVRTLSLVSAKKQAGLIVAAMSFGPAKIEPMANTQAVGKTTFPDVADRSGDPASIQGMVKNKDAQPLSGVVVRVMAVRKPNTADQSSKTDDPAVGTQAMTGPDGRFTLPPLPDDRLYRLAVAADGFETFLYRGADPKSNPIEIRLDSARPATAAKFAVRGRLMGPDGRPVAWATVEPDGVSTETGASWGGLQRGFPEQIITGTNGEFVFSRDEPFTRLQLKISSSGLAPERPWLDVSNAVQTVQMGVGATIRGRVLKDGKSLAKLRVGITGSDRNSMVFAGNFETRTDDEGVFTFKQVAPATSWYMSGYIGSFKPYGALPPKLIVSGENGQTNDLGDLEVVPGLRLAGQLQTRHGETLPKGLKIRVSYDTAWDSEEVSVNTNGQFSISGLFKGQVNVYPESPNWHPSAINRSLEMWNGGRWLTGLLEDDKTNLLIVIEKGGNQRPYGGPNNGSLPTPDWPQSRLLSGAEPGVPVTVIAGQVVDDKTGQPIMQARITPGRKPPGFAPPPPAQKSLVQLITHPLTKKPVPFNERPYMEYYREETLTNGNFSIEFIQLTSLPMLMVEADGYEPVQTDAISQPMTNLVIRLQRGTGPNGVVLLPGGKPADKATVIYAVRRDQFSLTGRQLNAYGQKDGQQQATGRDGKFSFPPRSQGVTLFISHPTGWAEEAVEEGGDGLKIRLKPWAAVTGTLVDSNGVPMAGVPLNLTMYKDWQQGGALVNIQGNTNTDAGGHFLFQDVPPRRIEIQRMIPFGTGGGWTSQLQTWSVPDPGITNDLGKVTYDKPPPATVMDRLKQNLGY